LSLGDQFSGAFRRIAVCRDHVVLEHLDRAGHCADLVTASDPDDLRCQVVFGQSVHGASDQAHWCRDGTRQQPTRKCSDADRSRADQDDHPEAGSVISGDFVGEAGGEFLIERRVLLEGRVYVRTHRGELADGRCCLVVFASENKPAEWCVACQELVPIGPVFLIELLFLRRVHGWGIFGLCLRESIVDLL
jgi:hypothetical protein